jgi:tRNA G10  N-methylase Trm11
MARVCVCVCVCAGVAQALLSANLAVVRAGHLVLDPCCGSGSIMVACAEWGAAVCGGDAGMAVLRGRLKSRRNGKHTPTSNFAQVGSTVLGLVQSPCSGVAV